MLDFYGDSDDIKPKKMNYVGQLRSQRKIKDKLSIFEPCFEIPNFKKAIIENVKEEPENEDAPLSID